MTFTCQNDKTHTYTETIPAKKYTFTVTVVDPTCTEQGYTLHTCNQNAENPTRTTTPTRWATTIKKSSPRPPARTQARWKISASAAATPNLSKTCL